MRGVTEPISLTTALASFAELWSPRIVTRVNDYDIRVVRVQGEFVRHQHVDTDELFLCLDGELEIRLDDGVVRLGPGELYVVPAGVHHQPAAQSEARVLLFEPSSVVNTGDAGGPMTAPRIEL